MSDLAQGQIGPEAGYAVKFEQGKLTVELKYAGSEAAAGLQLSIDAGAVLDAVKAAIPGKIDDAVIDLIKAALKA